MFLLKINGDCIARLQVELQGPRASLSSNYTSVWVTCRKVAAKNHWNLIFFGDFSQVGAKNYWKFLVTSPRLEAFIRCCKDGHSLPSTQISFLIFQKGETLNVFDLLWNVVVVASVAMILHLYKKYLQKEDYCCNYSCCKMGSPTTIILYLPKMWGLKCFPTYVCGTIVAFQWVLPLYLPKKDYWRHSFCCKIGSTFIHTKFCFYWHHFQIWIFVDPI